MNIERGFDCLKMKDAIQAKLREEWKGQTDEQVRHRIRHVLDTSDDPIAVWWRRVREQQGVKQA